MPCAKCGNADTKNKVSDHALGHVIEIICADCGTIETRFEYEPHPQIKATGAIKRASSPVMATTPTPLVASTPPSPPKISCPRCGGFDFDRHPGIKRQNGARIIEGIVCRNCGDVFVEHPDLNKATRLKSDGPTGRVEATRGKSPPPSQPFFVMAKIDPGTGSSLKPIETHELVEQYDERGRLSHFAIRRRKDT